MIENQTISLLAVILESVGILLAERRTAIVLGFVTLFTIIIFFMT